VSGLEIADSLEIEPTTNIDLFDTLPGTPGSIPIFSDPAPGMEELPVTKLAAVVADRAELAALPTNRMAYLGESGRRGMFAFMSAAAFLTTFGSSHTAIAALDTRQGLIVSTGAEGAWVRQIEDANNIQWWGATPGIGDVSAAVVEALAVLKAIRHPYGYGAGASNSLRFPAAHALRVHGENSGEPGGFGTRLTWSGQVTGFRFLSGSDGSIVERIGLVGGFVDTESEAHGIDFDVPMTIRDFQIYNFPGDALYAHNSGGGTGNSNGTLIDRGMIQLCRKAFHNQGADASACEIRGLRALSNRQCGVWEQGFLGNSHYSHEFATNARLPWNTGEAGHPCSFVTHGGNWYACANGQEAWCSTNAPSGTTAHNQGWIFWSAGGVSTGIPAWTNGINVRAGGGIIHSDVSNRSAFYSPYSEDDQFNQFDNWAQIYSPIWSIDPMLVVLGVVKGRPPAIITRASEGMVHIPGHMAVSGNLVASGATTQLGPVSGTASDGITYFHSTGVASNFLLWANNGVSFGGITAGYFYGARHNLNTGLSHEFQINGVTTALINSAGVDVTGNVNASGEYRVDGTKVLGNQQAAIADPAGGATVDTEGRAATASILAALRAHGIIVT
jgi:hypothetical protein